MKPATDEVDHASDLAARITHEVLEAAAAVVGALAILAVPARALTNHVADLMIGAKPN